MFRAESVIKSHDADELVRHVRFLQIGDFLIREFERHGGERAIDMMRLGHADHGRGDLG